VDVGAVLRRHGAAQRAFYRLLDGASPGARFVERGDGLAYAVTPARPERSLVNAVLYEDGEVLAAALPELGEIYDAAGVQAWTVWVHVGDDAAARACAAHGHVLDATPALMWAPLDDAFPLDVGPAAVVDDPSWRLLGDINDAAYGLPPDHLAVALADADPAAGLRAVALDEHDRPVAGACVLVAQGVAEVTMVATLPQARGRGLAAACMRRCLARGRDELGATATILEATKVGEPRYATMGYRRVGALGMWERRTTP
jgi:GNAT superfamily N-acetyltransferase